MKNYLYVLLLFQLVYFNSFSQTIVGKVYDSESTTKGIKVFNKTKNNFVFTNDTGDFSISAAVNDTLVFSSLFYKEKKLIITSEDFNNTMVIELKKIVNDLDEILLTDHRKEKPFNEKNYSLNLNQQLKNDIKNNPHLYNVSPNGVDLIKLASLITKLFRKKNKEQPIRYVDYKDLDSLFLNENIFDNNLLTNDLKIRLEYKSLFFDYCVAKNIDKKLLSPNKELELLNKLFIYSEEFLSILEEYYKK